MVYPAIFERNEDGSYTVTFPDLPGCITEGKDLDDAKRMAKAALTQWLQFLADEGMEIPKATLVVDVASDAVASM